MLLSERNKLAEGYKLWLKENPEIEDCPFNVVTFLDSRNLLITLRNKEEVSRDIEKLWSWNETNDEIWTHGTFNTKEEAIQDAIDCREWIEKSLSIDNPTIYIGECELVPLITTPDLDRIMEELDEAYCDDSGCDTYIYNGVTEEQRKWLEDKLSDLILEFHQRISLNPGWFKVMSVEEIHLKDYEDKVRSDLNKSSIC